MFGLGQYGKYATIGISWVVTTAVYLFLGYRVGNWLDARWGTAPIFFVVGLLFGMILSVMTLVKELLALTDAGVVGRRDDAGNNNGRDSEKNNFPKGVGPDEGESNGRAQGRNGPDT